MGLIGFDQADVRALGPVLLLAEAAEAMEYI